jgi:hypothetical protein
MTLARLKDGVKDALAAGPGIKGMPRVHAVL